MSIRPSIRPLALCACAFLGLGIATASADTGDVLRITGEKVNLRSGPSDDASIRSTVMQGTELIELRREGSWVGVRVQETGQEGWVFSDLVDRVAASNLDAGVDDAFAGISPEFGGLLSEIGEEAGYRMVDEVRQTDGDRLLVTPTADWMDRASRETKLMTALAIYEMWKNHNNGRPVRVGIVDRQGNGLVDIADGAGGPEMTVEEAIAAR